MRKTITPPETPPIAAPTAAPPGPVADPMRAPTPAPSPAPSSTLRSKSVADAEPHRTKLTNATPKNLCILPPKLWVTAEPDTNHYAYNTILEIREPQEG